MHEGKHIEEELYKNKVNLSELAKKLDISRGTLYEHFKRERADLNFIRDLKDKAGIVINISGAGVVEQIVDIKPGAAEIDESTKYQVQALNEYIINLQRRIIEQQDKISKLEKEVAALRHKNKPKNGHP